MGSGRNLIIDETVAFFKRVPPFQSLDDADLQSVAKSLSLEFYPKGTVILKQNESPGDSLRIIKKGSVKVSVISPEDGNEVVIDYRGEGDSFDFLSLMSRDSLRANITTVEDTICYLLGLKTLLKLLSTHRSFTEYFLKSNITQYIDRVVRELREKNAFHSGGDRLLFTTRAEDIAVKEVVSAPDDTTIQAAARIMVRKRISSIIVSDQDNQPRGIVTDRDLREKVVARGLSVKDPLKGIMSKPLISVDAQDYGFEIILKMIKHNIHHVMVTREGRLTGVITNHDLMMLQGTSPLSLTRDIESQQTLEGLVPVSNRVNGIVGTLLKEGAKAGNIIKIITEINDHLVRRLLLLAEKQLGKPPTPYCWLAIGSEGRREQTFKTDQDNALLLADPSTDSEAAAQKEYFAAFSEIVTSGLIQCGFPPCPANAMASNPRWRQPLRRWKRYFSDWIANPNQFAVVNAVTFFDFRPIHGDFYLAETLREELNFLLKDKKVFLGHLANMAIRNPPPIGFLKSFVVEKDGEHKDQLNIKIKGLAPLVDVVRLFALEKGILETSTIGRIEALRSQHTIVAENHDALEHAFEIIMLLRIHHQFNQIISGQKADNFINPNKLSNLEKRSLKEAFQLITRMQNLIIERYKALIW
jgi:CBS domain-containing protein